MIKMLFKKCLKIIKSFFFIEKEETSEIRTRQKKKNKLHEFFIPVSLNSYVATLFEKKKRKATIHKLNFERAVSRTMTRFEIQLSGILRIFSTTTWYLDAKTFNLPFKFKGFTPEFDSVLSSRQVKKMSF